MIKLKTVVFDPVSFIPCAFIDLRVMSGSGNHHNSGLGFGVGWSMVSVQAHTTLSLHAGHTSLFLVCGLVATQWDSHST